MINWSIASTQNEQEQMKSLSKTRLRQSDSISQSLNTAQCQQYNDSNLLSSGIPGLRTVSVLATTLVKASVTYDTRHYCLVNSPSH